MVFGILGKNQPKQEAAVTAREDAPTFERVDWKRDPGLRQLYFYAFILCIASATNGYDGMFFNSVQVFETWQHYFGKPTGSTLGLLGALYQIGGLCSLVIVPYLADKWGRKLPIVLGCVIMIIGGILQGCAQNLSMFIGGRILLGFGGSFTQMCSPMLLTELCHPQHRGRLTAVYNCLWNAGAIVVAWLSFGTNHINNDWSWRIPAVLQALPSVIQICFMYWVPESPRYLMSKDKHEQALEILAKYHANGDAQHPTVQFEYREIKDTIRMEMESKSNSSYIDFFRTKGNRYRLMVLVSLGIFSQWSGNAVISNYAGTLYEQAGIKDSNSKFGLSGGQTILSLIVSVSMATMVDRFGRRPIFLTSTGGMFGVFIFWTLCAGLYEQHQLPGSNVAMIFFIWLFGFFYSIAWNGLLIGYTIEILPYKLRAKGLMLMQITVQAALCLNTYVNPVAFEGFGENNSWKLYLIYTCWIFIELCVVYFLYVETKGPTLEELAKVIDGDGAQVAQVDLLQVEKEMAMQSDVHEVHHHEIQRKA
ncbi:general substrate transporter [Pseudomassariella vexata]|uniref:General substrate transporter n=1 Tax=Pseudomassariella vexata TaxID=1141098 RepID=A0A1Y2EBD3_9PEZI|nr:general substrate transporter [Pseudomassariella vexata]ORY68878.1 general substrate transporter [Pseudomassariella vexata]